MSGPLDLTPWRDRIANQVPTLRSVGLAADLAALRDAPRSTPQAFVVSVSDTPTARPGAGNSIIAQNVAAIVAVVLVCSNARGSSSGSEAVAEVQALRRSVLSALVGWTPPGADGSIQYGGGLLLEYQGSTVSYTDRFVTSYFIRKEFQE